VRVDRVRPVAAVEALVQATVLRVSGFSTYSSGRLRLTLRRWLHHRPLLLRRHPSLRRHLSRNPS
jgi:hypothetical protein